MIIYDTDSYEFERHSAGIILRRKSDGADVFFQPGDEANGLGDECEAFQRACETGLNVSDVSVFGAYFSE